MIIYRCVRLFLLIIRRTLFSEWLQNQRARGQQGKALGNTGCPMMKLSVLFPQDLGWALGI